VDGSVVQLSIEVYPKIRINRYALRTDFSRYGAAAHYYQPVTPGATTRVDLRLPASWEVAGGNTGWVAGYLTYRGAAIPPERITRVRAFTTGRGPECGVEGFAAGATELAVTQDGTATRYKVSFLAAGRCGLAAQRYSQQIDCLCDGSHRISISHLVVIARGRETRHDLAF